jgi:hypothetical protein
MNPPPGPIEPRPQGDPDPSQRARVAGNSAVITPESAEWVTDVAPATVKKFALTPVNVYPDVGVRVIVAV